MWRTISLLAKNVFGPINRGPSIPLKWLSRYLISFVHDKMCEKGKNKSVKKSWKKRGEDDGQNNIVAPPIHSNNDNFRWRCRQVYLFCFHLPHSLSLVLYFAWFLHRYLYTFEQNWLPFKFWVASSMA